MKEKCYFSVLRYVFDPITQEFVNIGLVLYAPESRFIGAICTNHYSRVSKMFGRIDGGSFRSLTRFIQDRVIQLNRDLSRGALFFNTDEKLETILGRILPEDDSAIRFVAVGAGITSNPEQSLAVLYERYVSRYESPSETARRDDEEIWRVFRKPMEKKNITSHLVPKRIVAKNYEYEFQRAWKNGIYHLYEPVSFDLVDSNSIVEKANKWLGRGFSLADSSEAFKLFLLLGEPKDKKLSDAFQRAQNILNGMPEKPELVQEGDAEEFAEEIEDELRQHLAEEYS
ncbi:MAG TPA: DUF3037 domain-containing protein [Acidobacteriaceae bacterium]|nr:DUF3037 domain-containing protein [Acidobacteriaceae bacterium]